MSKKSILFFTLTLLVVVVAFLMINQKQSPTPNDTKTDLKTYTSEQYKFKFNYPSSWLTDISGKPDTLVYESEIQGEYEDGGSVSMPKSTSASVELLSKFQKSDYEKCERKMVNLEETYSCPFEYLGNYSGYDVFEKIAKTVYYPNKGIALFFSASVPFSQNKPTNAQDSIKFLEDKYSPTLNNIAESVAFTN